MKAIKALCLIGLQWFFTILKPAIYPHAAVNVLALPFFSFTSWGDVAFRIPAGIGFHVMLTGIR